MRGVGVGVIGEGRRGGGSRVVLGLLTPNYIKKCIRMALALTPLSVPLRQVT